MLNYGIEVELKHAQKVHFFIREKSLLSSSFKPSKGKEKIIFPCKKLSQNELRELKKISISAKQIKFEFEERETVPRNMKEFLKNKISDSLLKFVPSAFDSLGDVAIVEIPRELKEKEKMVGEALLKVQSSFESVYAKAGAHQGIFREEPVKFIAGKKKKFATYRESGGVFRISLGKVFFSPRLSHERKRIAGKIKKGEEVAALFAGVGPFPIVFAKNSKMKSAVAIELNPAAVEDMKYNVEFNKVSEKVTPVLGDVKKLASEYAGKFDRAVMPLPKGGEDFLEDAIKYIKPSGGVVHYYQFVPKENPYKIPLAQIRTACKNQKRKFRVVEKRKVRNFAPDTIQVVVDFKVNK